jgi:hypothetical protein
MIALFVWIRSRGELDSCMLYESAQFPSLGNGYVFLCIAIYCGHQCDVAMGNNSRIKTPPSEAQAWKSQ